MTAQPEIILALAQAIAKPGSKAGEITPENNKGRTLPIKQAVSEGIAFYVQVRPEILALDLDAITGIEDALRFRDLYPDRVVVTASGQEGRAHIEIVTKSEQDKAEILDATKILRGVDNRATIRPPLAPHRLSECSPILLHPSTHEEALQRLKAPCKGKESLNQILINGWTKGTRSEGLYALTARFKTEREYIEAVMNHPEGAGQKVFEKLEHQREKYLSRTWHKAKAQSQRFRVIDSEFVENWHRCALDLLGHRRGEIKNVIALLSGQALEHGQDLNTSLRQLADIAGTSHGAIDRAITALKEAGLLLAVKDDAPYLPNTYTLVIPETYKVIHPSSHPPVCFPKVYQFGRIDALEHRSAAKTVVNALERLGGSATARAIAEEARSSIRAVQKQIQFLVSQGLIQRGKNRQVMLVEEVSAWIEVAMRRGTFEATTNRIARHQRDREQFSEKLAYLAERKFLRDCRREAQAKNWDRVPDRSSKEPFYERACA
jgi:hypothetical protein